MRMLTNCLHKMLIYLPVFHRVDNSFDLYLISKDSTSPLSVPSHPESATDVLQILIGMQYCAKV